MLERLSSAIKRDRVLINTVPIIIAAIVGVVIYLKFSDAQMVSHDTGLSICCTMISVWATCLGFLITAVSILLTPNNSDYIKTLKDTGHYKTILICFMSCCYHVLVALGFMIVITFIQKWSTLIHAMLWASTVDVLLIMGISLYFLLMIVIKIND